MSNVHHLGILYLVLDTLYLILDTKINTYR